MPNARWVVAEVWRFVQENLLDARSPIADAALDLRDAIDPGWWPVAEVERPNPRDVPRAIPTYAEEIERLRSALEGKVWGPTLEAARERLRIVLRSDSNLQSAQSDVAHVLALLDRLSPQGPAT